MKYLLLALTLFAAGCTSSSDGELKQAKRDLRFTTEQLETCQNQLSIYRDSGSSNANNSTFNQEESKPEDTGPQYETVNAYHITTKQGSTVCYDRNEDDIQCGMTFSDCKDGYVYRCMVDVKYKIVEEQKLVKEE